MHFRLSKSQKIYIVDAIILSFISLFYFDMIGFHTNINVYINYIYIYRLMYHIVLAIDFIVISVISLFNNKFNKLIFIPYILEIISEIFGLLNLYTDVFNFGKFRIVWTYFIIATAVIVFICVMFKLLNIAYSVSVFKLLLKLVLIIYIAFKSTAIIKPLSAFEHLVKIIMVIGIIIFDIMFELPFVLFIKESIKQSGDNQKNELNN